MFAKTKLISKGVFQKRQGIFRRAFDSHLLPHPADYYLTEFPNLKKKSSGWVNIRCCFHSPDLNPSLSINLTLGNFKCHACGAKGHDLIAFHRLRYGTTFIETITYFGAWNNG